MTNARRSKAVDTAKAQLPSKHDTPEWVEKFARVGFGAKGTVYLLVGVLAVMAVAGEGGSVGGSKNALASLGAAPFGQVLLALVALGLLAFTVWRLIQAMTDPGREGSDGKGIAKRIGYAASAVTHLALAAYAGSLVLGQHSVQASGGSGSGSASGSGSGRSTAADYTAELMAQPFGRWLVGILGAILVGVGVYQFGRAKEASFMDKYRRAEMEPKTARAAKRLGQIGLSARGVVFLIIGGFTIQAAVQAQPSETRGLGGALATLAEQPYGPWLLGLVAAGLAAYGLFCFSYARYRDFQHS